MRSASRGDADLSGIGRFDSIVQQIADGAADLFRIHQQLDLRIDGDRDADAALHIAIETRGLLQDLGELRVT